MPDTAIQPICRRTFDARQLVAEYPPRLQNSNKSIVYRIACPPGCTHGGRLVFSRWRAQDLPRTTHSEGQRTEFLIREDAFDYEPAREDGGEVHWYLNFADQHLFCAYGGPLFAQDEMQVAEHPVLGSLREALLHSDIEPQTVEDGKPTPVIIMGAERRCRVDTEPNASEGRPFGLYGNEFAQAKPEAIEQATTPIVPPTTTNLIAMEAPSYGTGAYTLAEITYILRTAFTGFSAARDESVRERAHRPDIVIHTGFWGCGAYGGNRVLMTLLQLLAARLSGVDRLVFHTRGGSEAPATALRILDDLLSGHMPLHLPSLLAAIQAMELQWGVSDGN
jgi:hypothetical protein